MPSRKRKDNLRALCAHIYPDDGVDPREDKRTDARFDRKPDRNTRQLCKQVARTVQLALGALPHVDALAGASVQGVSPAPNAGRLCVLISVSRPARPEQVASQIQRHSGRLRAEVAAAITRRRAPELIFEVITARGDHG